MSKNQINEIQIPLYIDDTENEINHFVEQASLVDQKPKEKVKEITCLELNISQDDSENFVILSW